MSKFLLKPSVAFQIAAALNLVLAPAAGAENAFNQKFAILDTGVRFVEIIGTPKSDIVLPTPQAMSLRFRDGDVAYNAKDAIIFDDPSLAPYTVAIHKMMAAMLNGYTKGPKPSADSIRFRIDYASDVNCMVVPVDEEQYSSVMTTVANTVFDPDLYLTGKPSQTVQIKKTELKKQAKARGTAKTEEMPSQIEMRCTSEAMKQLGDSNEMAFIIAHEMSHILLGHWERNDARIRQQKRMDSMLVDGASFIVAARSDYKFVDGEIVATPRTAEVEKDFQKLAVTTFLLNEYNLVIQGPSWEKDQEREADLMALDLMYSAGIKRTEAHEIMDKFDKAEKELRKNDSFIERLVKSVVADLLLSLQQSDFIPMEWFKKARDRVGWAVFSFWRSKTMTKVHDHYADRAAAIINYEKTHPDPAVDETAGVDAFLGGEDVFKAAPIRGALEPMENAMATIKTINGGGCASLPAERVAQIDAMMAPPPPPPAPPPVAKKGKKGAKTTPPPAPSPPPAAALSQAENFMLASYVKLCKGDNNGALKYAKAAANGVEKQATFYVAYIQLLVDTKNYSETLSVINEAETKAPPYTLYILPKVQATYQLGKKDEATKLAVVCRDFNINNEPLANSCMNSVGLNLDGTAMQVANDDKNGKSPSWLPSGLIPGGKSSSGT